MITSVLVLGRGSVQPSPCSSRGAAQKYSGSYSRCKKPVARTNCVERRCRSVLRLGSSTPMKIHGKRIE